MKVGRAVVGAKRAASAGRSVCHLRVLLVLRLASAKHKRAARRHPRKVEHGGLPRLQRPCDQWRPATAPAAPKGGPAKGRGARRAADGDGGRLLPHRHLEARGIGPHELHLCRLQPLCVILQPRVRGQGGTCQGASPL